MQREPVNSKAVASIGYDPQTHTLEIEFQRGRVYQYFDISPQTHAWLMRVPNKGAFIGRMLGDKEFRDVTPPPAGTTVDLERALQASIRVEKLKRD